jgi:hypothetical protein
MQAFAASDDRPAVFKVFVVFNALSTIFPVSPFEPVVRRASRKASIISSEIKY